MRGSSQPAEALPPDVRTLIEILFERMNAAVGHWELEFAATDGRLRRWHRHERGSANELEHFDRNAS